MDALSAIIAFMFGILCHTVFAGTDHRTAAPPIPTKAAIAEVYATYPANNLDGTAPIYRLVDPEYGTVCYITQPGSIACVDAVTGPVAGAPNE